MTCPFFSSVADTGAAPMGWCRDSPATTRRGYKVMSGFPATIPKTSSIFPGQVVEATRLMVKCNY